MVNSLTFTLHQVVWMMDRRADGLLQKHFHLNFHRFFMLAVLAKCQPCTQHSLAQCLGYSDAAVSRMLTNLNHDGLVEQYPDPTHGRRRLVRLTPAGASVTAEAAAFLEREFETFLESAAHRERLHNDLLLVREKLNQEVV
jgi:DNA-binding MarR family transcriptional regulator